MWAKSSQTVSSSPEHKERDYKTAILTEKTKADNLLIKKSIEGNSLFTCLDFPQVENFVKVTLDNKQ